MASTFRFGIATTVALTAIAVLSPILGALADASGGKKRMLALFAGTASLPHILIRYDTVKDAAAARKSTVVGIGAQADTEHNQPVETSTRLLCGKVDAEAHADLYGALEIDHPLHWLGDDQIAILGLKLLFRRCGGIGADDQRRWDRVADHFDDLVITLIADDDEAFRQQIDAGRLRP